MSVGVADCCIELHHITETRCAQDSCGLNYSSGCPATPRQVHILVVDKGGGDR